MIGYASGSWERLFLWHSNLTDLCRDIDCTLGILMVFMCYWISKKKKIPTRVMPDGVGAQCQKDF